MLHYLEMSEEAMREGGSVITEAAREAQLSLYIAQLDYLEERLHSSYTAHTKYNNYFTTGESLLSVPYRKYLVVAISETLRWLGNSDARVWKVINPKNPYDKKNHWDVTG